MENQTINNAKSKATIIDTRSIEVTAPDGEIFQVLSQIGMYLSEETQNHELRIVEAIFDKNFSPDKEVMINNIWIDSYKAGIGFLGIASGDRHGDRIRIGKRIKEIRESRNIEARELALLAGIDAANLSRIENGKYSVGIDILSKIATVLGKKIDLIDI